MIYLLLGNNPITKKNYIQEQLDRLDVDLVKFIPGNDLPDLEQLSEPILFGKSQAFLFEGIVANFDLPKMISVHEGSKAIIFISEHTLDKRKKETKELLANKKLVVKDFPLPEGPSALKWLKDRLDKYKVQLDSEGLDYLLLASQKESGELDVLKLENELKKLASFRGDTNDRITLTDLKSLVYNQPAVDVWQLTDLIAAKNKPATLEFLSSYFQSQSDDPKSVAIALAALLSDQFRSIWTVKAANSEGVSENQLLADTGWKPGRLFMVRKKMNNFSEPELKTLLTKLESLDKELKSSTMPHEVVFNLIFAQ